MSGQYSLTKEQQKKILEILDENNIDTSPVCVDIDEKGNPDGYHRDVSIRVCNYDDESKEYNMYIQLD